jgi:hypothetical protein
LKQAAGHHKAVLQRNPQNRSYQKAFRQDTHRLVELLLQSREHAEAARNTLEFSRLVPSNAQDTCDLAKLLSRCVRVVEQDGKLATKRRQELARRYGDLAMELLRQAVQNGYKDVEAVKKNPDLDPLRPRDDFKRLVADLEKVGKPGE